MSNPLITTDEVRNGNILATIEDVEYHTIEVVYKLNGHDSASFYCSMSDWPQTEAGRLSRYTAEIERLRKENEKLRTSLLLKGSHPITVEEALTMSAAVPSSLTCPHCGAGPFQRKVGLSSHIRFKHKETH